MGKLRPMGSYGSYCIVAIDDRKGNQGAEHELVQRAGLIAERPFSIVRGSSGQA
ncbi:MAG: hypothetical protein V3V92_05985 [Candidatus Hydrothermarchaeales archaeon]